MKKLLLLCSIAICSFTAFSQVKVVGQDIVEYNGQKYPCYVYEYPSAANLVEDAIKEGMLKAGYKTVKGPRNWLVYKNVVAPGNLTNEQSDMYFKVDENGKRDNLRSNVYLISTKHGEIVEGRVDKANRSSTAISIGLLGSGSAFLTGLEQHVGVKQFDADIKTQETQAEREEKKLEGLKSDQRRLENRIKDLQDELANNIKAQELQTNVVAKEKAKLGTMREKKTGPLAEKKD